MPRKFYEEKLKDAFFWGLGIVFLLWLSCESRKQGPWGGELREENKKEYIVRENERYNPQNLHAEMNQMYKQSLSISDKRKELSNRC